MRMKKKVCMCATILELLLGANGRVRELHAWLLPLCPSLLLPSCAGELKTLSSRARARRGSLFRSRPGRLCLWCSLQRILARSVCSGQSPIDISEPAPQFLPSAAVQSSQRHVRRLCCNVMTKGCRTLIAAPTSHRTLHAYEPAMQQLQLNPSPPCSRPRSPHLAAVSP